MGKVHIKGGTPVGSSALCRTCSNAHILSGYRESEMMVVCRATYPDFPVPFIVRECTGYNDRNRPDYEQMKKLAISVSRPLRLGKPAGFGVGEAPSVAVEDNDDFDEDD